MKFTSGKLKSQRYSIWTTFEQSHDFGETVAIADSQALRSIRDIRRWTVKPEKIERLFAERKLLRKRIGYSHGSITAYKERLEQVQAKIYRTMYVEDYVTVEIQSNKHYEHMFKHGFFINGKKYVRFSCAAGQARRSTVVFVAEEIAGELERRINNGRDMSKKLAPSKFNAYFGLATSGTKVVSEPRFCVVKDYENTATFMANFVTETDWDTDDDVDVREVTVPMNRTDGMGLISPQQSAKWAEELGLDYVPGQWVIRQSFLKGMVCTFDFHRFCEEKNGRSYEIDTIYTDDEGNPIKVDLRDVDVIISESQFKLWDSFPSVEQYVKNCHENKLYWGITQQSPKELKDVLRLNYQFIQTLDLSRTDAEKLCGLFVDWIEGVSYRDRAYMLLFLLGKDIEEDEVENVLDRLHDDQGWIKALAVNSQCCQDPFIRSKIQELIQNKIEAGYCGEVLVRGNFQFLVSDPYAFAQHVCGQEPVGLLGEGEYYCNYWNQRGVKVVDSMRSPMTGRSEHVVAPLVCASEMEDWYQYCQTGWIIGWHGDDCIRYAGADSDGDLVATTDCETMIKCAYRDELPVIYDVPKPEKIVHTKDDLYKSDLFGFGSIIGRITNQGTNAYALLPIIEDRYGKNSPEAALVNSRIKQCVVAQGKQIDKTKLGRPVKGIPCVWGKWLRIEEDDTAEEKNNKRLMNACLLNRRPYFFRYRYPESKAEFDEYYEKKDAYCRTAYGLSLAELKVLPQRTIEQHEWLQEYYNFCPVTDSDSAMNLVCKYLESIRFGVRERICWFDEFDYTVYMDDRIEWVDYYNDVVKCYKRFVKSLGVTFQEGKAPQPSLRVLREQLRFVCPDEQLLVDCLVWYAYGMHPHVKKSLIWSTYGTQMQENARQNAEKRGEVPLFPARDDSGDVEYLGRRYAMKEVTI